MSKAAAGRERVLDAIRKAGEPVAPGTLAEATGISGVFLSHSLLGLYAKGEIEPVHAKWGKSIVLRWQIRKPYDVEV